MPNHKLGFATSILKLIPLTRILPQTNRAKIWCFLCKFATILASGDEKLPKNNVSFARVESQKVYPGEWHAYQYLWYGKTHLPWREHNNGWSCTETSDSIKTQKANFTSWCLAWKEKQNPLFHAVHRNERVINLK